MGVVKARVSNRWDGYDVVLEDWDDGTKLSLKMHERAVWFEFHDEPDDVYDAGGVELDVETVKVLIEELQRWVSERG